MDTFDEARLLSCLEYVIKEYVEAKVETCSVRPKER